MILINTLLASFSYHLRNYYPLENVMGCCGGCGGEGHEPAKTETEEQQEQAKKQTEEE